MKRREFILSTAAAGAALASTSSRLSAQPHDPGKRALMKLGCQSGPTSDTRLQFFARHGVKNICGIPDETPGLGYPTVDQLLQLKERAAKWGVSIDMIMPSFLASSHIDRTARPAIMLGQSPERDRDIERIQNLIANCAKAGIPSFKYNMSILGVLRTGRTPGRGGARYSTWRLAEAKPRTPLTRAGVVTADLYWERITYFLERVVPVANEHKIRMACHPHDPGVPPGSGYQGVDAVLGTVEGLKKFISIQESPYHGLNFCQGTVSEMLQDPGQEIFEVIRYFGSRQKIFNVHFRNIRGKRDDFMEVYPDEGDIDFVQAMRVYKEVGYSYMMMPDHVPMHPDDPGGSQAFAFAYGYIRALIQAVDQMG
ncbi:MAG: mannonate dehydratase [Verrucomicrobia bacterium]|nr:mannonate dehydratase [Verrucomicrobiota bacterium]